MSYQFDFRDKIIAVTGGGRGIGRSIAMVFGSLGAKVIVISRTEEELKETAEQINQLGGEATLHVADLSEPQTIPSVIDFIQEHFGRLDVLVNNAGVTRRKKSEELTEEDWDFVMDTNLKALALISFAVAKNLMIPQGYGKIINIASMGGILAITESAPYSSSKGGVIQLTKVLGCEWAKYNIQVNAVAPGYINAGLGGNATKNQELMERVLARTPAKRLGNPEEVVGGVLFLASDLASYITGQTLAIDGGLTAYAV